MRKRQRSKRKKGMELEKEQGQKSNSEQGTEVVVKKEKDDEKEEDKEDKEEEKKTLSPPVSAAASPPPSTSTQPQEAVVAQLNQLQQTVVSHILQYQAGVMAQFQQLQQQMLSQLGSTTQPQVTITPQVKNERKRPASSMSSCSESRDETRQVGEMHFKRKRTAFNEKQYKVLETTFEHNNFPEPIDQHCIALRIKTPYRSIKMWFQNKRASVRKRLSPKEKGIATSDSKTVKNASDPDARWYCTLCPSTFIAKKFLDSHKEAHKNQTLYCPHCNMRFTHKVLLDTHKISKCTSKTGVDLTHLDDDSIDNVDVQGKVKIPRIVKQAPSNQQSSPTLLQAALPLLLLQKLQKEQQQQQESPSSPPPLIDPGTLSQIQENPVMFQQQQQRLMQQLLLAQLQQAQSDKVSKEPEKDKKEAEEQAKGKQKDQQIEEKKVTEEKETEDKQVEEKQAEEEQDQQQEQQPLQLQLQQQIQQQQIQQQLLLQQQKESKELESPKGSLTVGGLTIFPVQASSSEEMKVKVKEEVQDFHPVKEEEKQPSTLQDQITAILQSHGLKSVCKTAIKSEPEDPSDICKERESMQEQIQAILRHQEEQRQKMEKNNRNDIADVNDLNNIKRHRRRTTVFNEVQLRTLYLHFTYCNFPDPSMFKIIGHLTKLEPQVIKIWFQNERSRQRKRATHIVDEVNSKEKPYKCRDCGMSFAMLTFLVKHSMRHNGDTDQDASVRTCPLCQQKWNKEVFAGHLKSRHNVNLSLVDEKLGGALMCYLCEEKFSDQESLMIHKHKHLKDDYGDPPQCSDCKTTFVNAICLEAHMETHRHHDWNYKCNLCGALFHDKILLMSHRMGHGVPLAPVSTIDRSRSQLQHTSVRAIHARARKTVASAITCLNNSPPENNEVMLESESTKSDCSVSCSTPVSSPSPSKASEAPMSTASAVVSPTVLTHPSTVITPSSVNSLPFTPSSGPVSYVKLIPVQLVPVNSINNTLTGQKNTSLTTVSSGGITSPTTTFISVPISIKGSSESNAILNYVLEATPPPAKLTDDKHSPKKPKKKTLPNLIPITQSAVLPLKEKNIDGVEKVPPLIEMTKKPEETKNGIRTDNQNNVQVSEGGTPKEVNSCSNNHNSTDGLKNVKENTDIPDQINAQDSQASHQVTSKKRYVPILPMIPIQIAPQEPQPAVTTETPVTHRTRSTRNVPNKRLWQSFDPVGYKRRRTPTYFTGNQRDILEAHFEHDNFPEPVEQMAIANQLGVDYAVVKTWFQNTRKNYRKQLKEEENYEGDGPFHCQKCNVSYIARKTLNEHYEKHNSETSFHCGECGVYFAHPSVFNTHLMSHMSKVADSKRKKYGVDALARLTSRQAEALSQIYDGDNEDASYSDSQEESIGESTDTECLDRMVRSQDDSVDGTSDDVDDYHPIMAVECILDNSSEEDYEAEAASESPGKNDGHKCASCEESFASLIALKEHYALQCCQKNSVRKPGEWRRRKKIKGKRKQKVGNEIRCFECHLVFPDRASFLEHFNSSRCNVGRQRIEYTDEEQAVLVTHYNENNFPVPSEMSLLARRLGVRYRQIMHWFQNRRSKERKQQRQNKNPPVECQHCKASFVTDANLKHHEEVVHNQVDNSVSEFACLTPGCDAVFNNVDLLQTHRLAHQIDSDSAQNEENAGGHKLPSLGHSPLWKNFTVLEAHYSDNNFPDPMDIGFIARRLEVDPLHIHMWFKERRNQHIHKLEESGRQVMEGEAAVSAQKAMSKVCSTCDAAFICQTDVETHEEMHKSSWAQVCSMCGKEYSNVIALETHWIRHGIEVSRENEQNCESKPERTAKATFTITQLKILDTHYEHNNFPGATEVWLVAKRLGLRPRQVTHWFQNKRGRDRRVQKISTPYSCTCPLCGAAFICEIFLNNHKKLHKVNRRFPCTQCGAIFISSILQETHLLYHDAIARSKDLFQKPLDGSKGPLTEGQAKPGDNLETDESEGSEPELRIDDTENIEADIENTDEDTRDDLEIALKEAVSDLENAEKKTIGVCKIAEKDGRDDLEICTADILKKEVGTEYVEDSSSWKSEDQVRRSTVVEVAGIKSTITEEKIVRLPEKKIIREEVFFDDNTDSEDDDDDEPRLKIVSAYTISPNAEDLEFEGDL